MDHLDQVVLKPLGGEGKQGKEEHIGGRVGDELHERVSHEPGFGIKHSFNSSGTFQRQNVVP